LVHVSHSFGTIVDTIAPVISFQIPELIDKHSRIAKAIFASSINEVDLRVKLPIPSLSLDQISEALGVLTMKKNHE
jgi:hypothetical protein